MRKDCFYLYWFFFLVDKSPNTSYSSILEKNIWEIIYGESSHLNNGSKTSITSEIHIIVYEL